MTHMASKVLASSTAVWAPEAWYASLLCESGGAVIWLLCRRNPAVIFAAGAVPESTPRVNVSFVTSDRSVKAEIEFRCRSMSSFSLFWWCISEGSSTYLPPGGGNVNMGEVDAEVNGMMQSIARKPSRV